jgi:Putative beta-barrel porin 2
VLEGRYELTSPGFRPFVEVGFASRGERVGFEIDTRAHHTQSTMIAGADVDITPMTALSAWVGRSATAYDENQEYVSFMLADQLNHSRDTAAAGARFRVTPLTTVLMAAEFERDRFEIAPLRNADSFRVGPAIALDTGAALTGNAKGGFRAFTPSYPDVPSYRGFVGNARLHYALPDVIKVDLEANRDLSYSYDPIQPYYMESGARLTAVQRIFGPLELIGIAERREIRNQRIGGRAFDGRRELTTSLGGGFGIQFQNRTRFTFTYEHTRRTSTEPVGRDYERTRVLGSISYGL